MSYRRFGVANSIKYQSQSSWGIGEISGESDIPHEQMVDESGRFVLSNTRDFETFTVSRADRRMVCGPRKIPKKYTAEDSRKT
jgi:hypothetical protein